MLTPDRMVNINPIQGAERSLSRVRRGMLSESGGPIMSDSDRRTATVRPSVEHEATGRVAEIYADIKRTKNIDFVPRFWQVIATNPHQLELVWNSLKSLMHSEASGRTSRLDAKTRETIALAVSATNACPYCINSHTAALRKLGVDQETLGEIMAIVGLFNMTNALANGYQVEPDVKPPLD
jgi:AhpD family alkylhydroperoxidase